MGNRQRTRTRPCSLVGMLFSAVLLFMFYRIVSDPSRPGSNRYSDRHAVTDDLVLTQSECAAVFPGLTDGLDYARSLGSFDLEYRKNVVFQAKIVDDELYILQAPRKGDASAIMRHRQSATINQIYRALKSSPEPMPNVSIAFGTHDKPLASSIAYARPIISPSKKHIFPMPHFSFWSWPLPFINSLPAAGRAVSAVEAEYASFQDKDPRAVWRGTTWFSNGAATNPRSRQDLVALAGGQRWADVEKLDWETNSRLANNALNIEDFCRYRYVIHTEGIGYSGRLQFHQLCESVVLSPPLEWMQHTSHLIKPIFSSTLLGQSGSSRYPSSFERERWPVEYGPYEANMVFVAPDWSDLEATVLWLEAHQDVATSIARRQRQTYHDGGYLSPAAEVCYWRELLRAWSDVARPVGEQWDVPGMPFEEFISGSERGH